MLSVRVARRRERRRQGGALSWIQPARCRSVGKNRSDRDCCTWSRVRVHDRQRSRRTRRNPVAVHDGAVAVRHSSHRILPIRMVLTGDQDGRDVHATGTSGKPRHRGDAATYQARRRRRGDLSRPTYHHRTGSSVRPPVSSSFRISKSSTSAASRRVGNRETSWENTTCSSIRANGAPMQYRAP